MREREWACCVYPSLLHLCVLFALTSLRQVLTPVCPPAERSCSFTGEDQGRSAGNKTSLTAEFEAHWRIYIFPFWFYAPPVPLFLSLPQSPVHLLSCLFSHRAPLSSSRRGVSAVRVPSPLPCALPAPRAAGSLRASAPQEDVSQGVAPSAALTTASTAAASWRRRGHHGPRRRGPPGKSRATVRRRDGNHPGHMGLRLQKLRGHWRVCAH